MSSLTADEKYKSIVAQYHLHYERVGWFVNYRRENRAECGCGIVGGREVVCKEAIRIVDRMVRLEIEREYPTHEIG